MEPVPNAVSDGLEYETKAVKGMKNQRVMDEVLALKNCSKQRNSIFTKYEYPDDFYFVHILFFHLTNPTLVESHLWLLITLLYKSTPLLCRTCRSRGGRMRMCY